MQSKKRAYRGYFGDYLAKMRRQKFNRGVRMIPNIDLGLADHGTDDGDLRGVTWTEASNGCFCPRLCEEGGVMGTSFEILAKPGVWDQTLRNEHHGRMLELAQTIGSGALRETYTDRFAAQAGPGVLDSICEFGYGVMPIRFMDSSRLTQLSPSMDLNGAHGMLVASMAAPWLGQVTHTERKDGHGILDDAFWDACLEPPEVDKLLKREAQAAALAAAAATEASGRAARLLDGARDACCAVVRAVQEALDAGDVGPCAKTALVVARSYRTLAVVGLARGGEAPLVEADKCCASALFDPVCAWVTLELEEDVRALVKELNALRQRARAGLQDLRVLSLPSLRPLVPTDPRPALYCPGDSTGAPPLNDFQCQGVTQTPFNFLHVCPPEFLEEGDPNICTLYSLVGEVEDWAGITIEGMAHLFGTLLLHKDHTWPRENKNYGATDAGMAVSARWKSAAEIVRQARDGTMRPAVVTVLDAPPSSDAAAGANPPLNIEIELTAAAYLELKEQMTQILLRVTRDKVTDERRRAARPNTARADRGRVKGKDRKKKGKAAAAPEPPAAAPVAAAVLGAPNAKCGICLRARPAAADQVGRDFMDAPIIVCRNDHAMCAGCARAWRQAQQPCFCPDCRAPM